MTRPEQDAAAALLDVDGALTEDVRRDLAVAAALYTAAPIGIAVLDADGRYVRINDMLAAVNGRTPQEHVGRLVEDVLGDGAADLRRLVDTVVRTGRPVPADDVVIADARGTRRTWRTTWVPMSGPGPSPGSPDAVVGVVALAMEVTEQRRAEQERAQALRRAQLLARTGELLQAGLGVDETLDAVLDLMVPEVGDLVTVHLLEERRLRLAGMRHRDRQLEPELRRVLGRVTVDLDGPYGAGHVTRTGRVQALPSIDEAVWQTLAAGDERWLELMRRMGPASGLVLPLQARGRVFGAVSLVRSGDRAVSATDSELATDIVRRAALALDNARLFEQQRRVSVTLQRALLPSRAGNPAIETAARYVPGVDGLEVGGDWYDVVPLADGRIGLVLGDVMGRGVRAAAVMGQLRAGLRAYARLQLGPAQVMVLLDELVRDLDSSTFVTAIYGELDVAARTFTFARAGHLPPVVQGAVGAAVVEDGVVGTPLGTAGPQRAQSVALPMGSTLALYSDGLVEDRERDIDDGLADLRSALASGPHDLEQLAEHVLESLGRAHGHDDDVALLLVRIPAVPPE